MLISSSTSFMSDVSQVATGTFSDISGYLIFVLGIIVGFFVVEKILESVYPEKYPKDDTV